MVSLNAVFIIAYVFIALLLLSVKTYYFYKCTRRRSLLRWFYFNQYHIVNAPTQKVMVERKKQNRFTLIFFLFVLCSPVIFILLSSFL
jgi:hypothetical protein